MSSTLSDVRGVVGMQEFLSVFVLQGYEDLALFKDLDDEELGYLGVSNEQQRENLLAMDKVHFPLNERENWDD